MLRRNLWAVGGGLLFLLQCLWFRRFQVDDAFITYRYARNWADGLGPVMNAGEHIEGVSNLPWTALLALLARTGLVPHEVGPVLGVLCGLGCVVLTMVLGYRWTAQRTTASAAGLLLATAAPVAIWSVSGLETLGYTLSVLVFFYWATDPRWRDRNRSLGVALVVVAAMRPEGFLCALAWAVTAALRSTLRRQLPGVLVGFAALAIPLLALRLWYYGEWFANPLHAKSSLALDYWAAGSIYVAKFAIACLPLVVLSGLGGARKGGGSVRILAITWVVLQVLFAIGAGGERFPGYRLLVPALPMLALLAASALFSTDRPGWQKSGWRRYAPMWWGLIASMSLVIVWNPEWILPLLEPFTGLLRLQQESLQHHPRLLAEARFLGLAVAALATMFLCRIWRPGLVVWVTAAWMILAALVDPSLTSCRRPGSAAYHGRAVGLWLRTHAPADVVVATNAAGALPYFSRLPVIDMLGLTDGHIARAAPDRRQWIGHERGDGAYVLGRHPDIIVLGGPEGSSTPWSFPGDQQIAAADEFVANYELQQVQLETVVFTYWRARQGRMPQQEQNNENSENSAAREDVEEHTRPQN